MGLMGPMGPIGLTSVRFSDFEFRIFRHLTKLLNNRAPMLSNNSATEGGWETIRLFTL